MKISKTYEIVTPESAAHGEADEMGFEFENEEVTFRELVDLMREHPQGSSSPCAADIRDWFTSYEDTGSRAYFERGESRTTSIHFSRENKPRHAKYWRLAARAAGLTD